MVSMTSIAKSNNATNTTSTVLSKTCTNGNTWVQKTFSLSTFAGKSVTLTLTDHDDGYTNPPDPTYTLFDDVVLQ